MAADEPALGMAGMVAPGAHIHGVIGVEVVVLAVVPRHGGE